MSPGNLPVPSDQRMVLIPQSQATAIRELLEKDRQRATDAEGEVFAGEAPPTTLELVQETVLDELITAALAA